MSTVLLLNQTWFADELRQLGMDVVTAGWVTQGYDIWYPGPGTPVAEVIDHFKKKYGNGAPPDFLVYYDDSAPLSLWGIEHLQIPTIFYSVDAHHHSAWHSPMGACFDRVLVAQPDYLPLFKEFNPSSEWFPLWAPIYAEPNPVKSIDICFRGTLKPSLHPKRAAFFDQLAKEFSVDAGVGSYVEDYSRAKIVVNQVVFGDLNFRNFEAMMCGAMLITPQINNGLSETFTQGVHIATYVDSDVEDAKRVIRYYLNNEEERARIAACGRDLVLERHTSMVRAQRLIDIFTEIQVTDRPLGNFGAATAYAIAAHKCFPVDAISSGRYLRYALHSQKLSCAGNEPIGSRSLAVMIFLKYLLDREGSFELALEVFSEFYETAPSKDHILLCLIDTLMHLGRLEEARGFAELIVNHNTGHTLALEDVRELLGQMYRLLGLHKSESVATA